MGAGEARRRSRRNARRILRRIALRQVSVHVGDAPQAYHPMAELQRLGVAKRDRFTTLLGFPRFYDAGERLVTNREGRGYTLPVRLDRTPQKTGVGSRTTCAVCKASGRRCRAHK